MKIIDQNGRVFVPKTPVVETGTVSVPSISFLGDDATGIFQPAVGALGIAAAEVLTLKVTEGQVWVSGFVSLGSNQTYDTYINRGGPAIVELGVSGPALGGQTLKAGDAVAGSNLTGPDLTIAGGKGTGSGPGGALVFQTAPAGSSGTSPGTLATRLRIAADGSSTFSGEVKFSGTTHPGLRLNSLTSTQRDAITAALGMLLWNSSENALNIHNGSSWKGVPQHALEASGRVFQSRLPNVGTAITLQSGQAYFVYLGRTVQAVTVQHVEFYVDAAASGAQTAEVALLSSSSAPNKSDQSLTRLAYSSSLDSLGSAGVKRNTSAFNYTVAPGTHLWAGLRCAMTGNQPGIAGLCMDFNEGLALVTASATAFGSATSWLGIRTSPPGPNYLSSPIVPDLRVVLDT